MSGDELGEPRAAPDKGIVDAPVTAQLLLELQPCSERWLGAMRELARRRDPELVDALLSLGARIEGPCRAEAIAAIVELGSPAVGRILRAERGPGGDELGRDALAALGPVGIEELARAPDAAEKLTPNDALVAILGSEGADLVSHIAGEQDDPVRSIEPGLVVSALESPRPGIRVAAPTLVRLDASEPQLVAALTERLGDPVAAVRERAAAVLAEIGPGALIRHLDASEPAVRMAAAHGLGTQGSRYVEVLTEAARLGDPETATGAAYGLVESAVAMGPQEGASWALPALDSPSPQLRWAAVESLGRLRVPTDASLDVAEALGSRLMVVEETIHAELASGLVGLGEEAAPREVAATVNDEVAHVLADGSPRARLATLEAIRTQLGRAAPQVSRLPAWLEVDEKDEVLGAIAEMSQAAPSVEAGAADAVLRASVLERRARDRSGLHRRLAAVTERPPLSRGRHLDATIDHADGAERLEPGVALTEGKEYVLEVTLRGVPTGIPIKQGTERKPFREPDQEAVRTLWVVATGANGVELEETIQAIELPVSGDPDECAVFPFRPTRRSTSEADLGEIGLRVFMDLNLVERAVIRAEVRGPFETAPAHSESSAGGPITLQQLEQIQSYDDLDQLAPRAIHIDVERPGSKYVLTFTFQSRQEIELSASLLLSPEEIETELATLRAEWNAMTKGALAEKLEPSADEQEETLGALRRVGERLWRTLFGTRVESNSMANIGGWLERYSPEPGSTIQISIRQEAADLVFPWSVLYPPGEPGAPVDQSRFWGAQFVIEQQAPGRQGSRAPAEAPKRSIVGGTWRFGNLADHWKELEEIANRANPEIDLEELKSAKQLRQRLLEGDTGDILYVYAHGKARRRILDAHLIGGSPSGGTESDEVRELRKDQTSWLMLTAGKVLLEDELHAAAVRFERSPLVFLNTCSSNAITPTLRDGFASWFLSAGASCVIGTECYMTTTFAAPFGQAVLEAVAEGRSVGDALLEERRSMLSKGNPLGLAYSLYGSASAALAPAPIAAEVP